MNFEGNLNLDSTNNELDYEDAVYDLLEDKEISLLLGSVEVKKIEAEIGDIENDADAKKLYERVKNRLKYLTTPFIDFDNSESVFEKNIKLKATEKTRKKIERIIEKCKNGELDSVGKGFTAEVFQSKTCPKCCYKVIHDIDEYRKGCTIEEEALIQDILSELDFDDVTVPHPYYSRMTPESHFMVMETLDACTVKDILEGRESLPKGFDLEKEIEKLKAFIREMHSLGIHHRDFHDKNVLIGRKTGKFAVIDFGKAKTGCERNLEQAYRHEDDIYIEEKNSEQIRYKPTDLEYLEIHYQKLKQLIYNNKD